MDIECGRGHWYDPNIYSSCPRCNASQQAINPNGIPVVQDGKTMPPQGYGSPVASGGNTMPPSGYGAQPGIPVVSDGKTMPPPGYGAQPGAQPGVQPGVRGVPVGSDGNTAPPKGYTPPKAVTDENVTIGMMRKKMGIDPVVGWLVCVAGKEKGKGYELKGRINTIGRSGKMDICIKDDKTITDENHARLGYSEKNNRFTLIPAENTNVIYLNGEDIYESRPLKAFDVIDFGETQLIFIPLCCERFDWSSEVAGGDTDATV